MWHGRVPIADCLLDPEDEPLLRQFLVRRKYRLMTDGEHYARVMSVEVLGRLADLEAAVTGMLDETPHKQLPRKMPLARLVLGRKLGRLLTDGERVVFVDGSPANLRRDNLRLASD